MSNKKAADDSKIAKKNGDKAFDAFLITALIIIAGIIGAALHSKLTPEPDTSKTPQVTLFGAAIETLKREVTFEYDENDGSCNMSYSSEVGAFIVNNLEARLCKLARRSDNRVPTITEEDVTFNKNHIITGSTLWVTK